MKWCENCLFSDSKLNSPELVEVRKHEPFLRSLHLQVKKQSCLFEHWRWTIFSHWDSGTGAVLHSESSAECCWDSTPRRRCPYMAHAEAPLLSVSAAPSLCVLLLLVSLSIWPFASLHRLSSRLRVRPLRLPLCCGPAPVMFSRGSPMFAPCLSLECLGLTQTHTHIHRTP